MCQTIKTWAEALTQENQCPSSKTGDFNVRLVHVDRDYMSWGLGECLGMLVASKSISKVIVVSYQDPSCFVPSTEDRSGSEMLCNCSS